MASEVSSIITIIIAYCNITVLWLLWQRNVPACRTVKEFWFWSSQWALVIPSEHFLCLSLTFINHFSLWSISAPTSVHCIFGPDYIVCFPIQTLPIHIIMSPQGPWIKRCKRCHLPIQKRHYDTTLQRHMIQDFTSATRDATHSKMSGCTGWSACRICLCSGKHCAWNRSAALAPGLIMSLLRFGGVLLLLGCSVSTSEFENIVYLAVKNITPPDSVQWR